MDEKINELLEGKKEEEIIPLTKEELEEKKGLKIILKDLYDNLDKDDQESINDVYGEYLNNEDVTKRYISDTGRICLAIMFYILSPLFSLINLIAVFQSIYIFDTLAEIIRNSISYYYHSLFDENIEPFSIDKFNQTYNFYNRLLTRTLNEPFDFNLMMFMAFLGDALLKAKGLTFTIILFGIIINGIAFLLLYSFNFKDYDPDKNTYSILRILILIGCYILLFIGVGSCALLSQQIIVESNAKYNEYLNILKIREIKENPKKEEEKRKREEEKKKLKDDNKKKKESENDNDKNKELIDVEQKLIDESKEAKDTLLINDDEVDSDKKSDLKLDSNLIDKSNEDKEVKPVNDEKEVLIDIKSNTKDENQKKEEKTDDDFQIIDDSLKLEKESSSQVKRQKLKRNLTLGEKLQKKKEIKKRTTRKLKKKEKSRFDSFFEICLTTILAYFSKYFININLTNKMLNYKEKIIESNSLNNTIDIEVFMKNTNSSKVNQTLYNSIIKDLYSNDEFLYLIMIASYGISLFVSWVFYKIFVRYLKKEEIKVNNDEDTHRICEIFGYIIYSENKKIVEEKIEGKIEGNEKTNLELEKIENVVEIKTNLEKKEKKGKCESFCKCLKLLIETVINCFNNAICFSFVTCIACHEESDPEDFMDCCCCCCCVKYNEEDYKKETQCFCYCYEAKRKQNWLNKFLTNEIQQKIVPYLIEYFILRLSIIGFEKQYEINDIHFKIEENYIFIGVFAGTFFLFFYFTLSFSKFFKLIDIEQTFSRRKNLSNDILFGINGILFFTSAFSLSFSSIFHSNVEDEQKNFIFSEHNYIIFIPLLMSKFYHFTLIYFCISYSEDKKKFELISGSTLITIYLSIWEFIISFIKNLCDENSINALYITQLVISCLVLLYFLFILFIVVGDKMCSASDCPECSKELGKFCCFLTSFFVCCSGFWYEPAFYDDIDCDTDCFCNPNCPIDATLVFNCCFCQEDNFFYCSACCYQFNFCNPCDYLHYIICCCCCCDCCSCCNCEDNCNCCSCDCECKCDCCGDCCDCCFLGYCCYCCDCCEIYDCCGCCSCIYCCGDSCSCLCC